MIKQTLYFGNPAYLSLTNSQMIWRIPEEKQTENLPSFLRKETYKTFDIEDIGFIILDHPRITITQALIAELAANNVILMTCDKSHHPSGMSMSLNGNSLLTERHLIQVKASPPLKKQLWSQLICQKIKNQGESIYRSNKNLLHKSYLNTIAKSVKSGDSTNREAHAAAYYWERILPEIDGFQRSREGFPPNNYFNYAYSLVRAAMARAIVGTGLIPSLGIFHKNKYNPFCLADDMIEPFRPILDCTIVQIIRRFGINENLNKEIKTELLKTLAMDIKIGGETSPLMIACNRSVQSLFKCYDGISRKLILPEFAGKIKYGDN